MRKFFPLAVENIADFKQKLLLLSKITEPFCFLESNNYPDYPYSHFGSLAAIEALEEFKGSENPLDDLGQFQRRSKDWIFGYLSYDLKNYIEPGMVSQNYDGILFPEIHFFIPKYLVFFYKEEVLLGVIDEDDIPTFWSLLDKTEGKRTAKKIEIPIHLEPRLTKVSYLEKVAKLRQNIARGDIYEVNFCMELFTENVDIEPSEVFQKLTGISKAPFCAFYKTGHHYLACSSPERFLKREKNKLISQPIKGTRKRSLIYEVDQGLKTELFNDPKERAENVMIVDLVRNDLSQVAENSSVKVEELYGIYTFETVHQMISTITAEISPETELEDIIKATFPMGSMTGAPKISAMLLAEKYEATKRGLYSGAVGYITPQGNFDFNVVIRSILYNADNKYLSIQVGSAITFDSDAKKEYDECLLKAEGMIKALK